MIFHPVPTRQVEDEWLDHLPPHDPAAQRSRRDLRLINALMGNERWILRQLPRWQTNSIVVHEWGAGDGTLTRRLAQRCPSATIIGYDLQPRPVNLPPNIFWHQADLTQINPPPPSPEKTSVLICNLFLHHFFPSCPTAMTAWWPMLDLIVVNEPWRLPLAHFWGRLLHPFINDVTRHDLHVSIRAGFSDEELIEFLRLERAEWQSAVWHDWRGAQRWVLRRREKSL